MRPDEILAADKRHVWHPFTQMRDWCAEGHEPLVIARGEGAMLYDADGIGYLDGNSSIWTNIHGHNHPALNAAITEQLGKIAHASFLGLTNGPAAELAARLTGLFPPDTLTRVFYSDDGSTAIECALKMALQFWQHAGKPERCEFAAFDLAYHGDTLGAASLGGIDVFHARFARFGHRTHHVAEAGGLNDLDPKRLAAVVIEPLIQGAAGMRTWPRGMLRELRDWCDRHEVFLVADEVMTGFGRTGKMFACEHEDVVPDLMALAKGLTGGYLPLGATLTTERVFEAFLGDYAEMKTFFHGHSYCGNPLACAAALASLRLFEEEHTLATLPPKIARLTERLAALREAHPTHVGAIRQCGFIAGIDLVRDAASGEPFPGEEQTGARVCQAARRHGLLTRPVRDTLVLMLPLCATLGEIDRAVAALGLALRDTLSGVGASRSEPVDQHPTIS